MSNITDIAKRANVSRTTVSRVMNNHPYVKEEKRDAVLKAIEELNYMPNLNAVHLSKGKTNVFGVVVPKVGHPFFSNLTFSERSLHLQACEGRIPTIRWR